MGDRNDALDLHVVYVAWQTMSNGGEGIGEEGILVRMGVSVSVYIIYIIIVMSPSSESLCLYT